MRTNSKSLAILFWGRRGGGLELFDQVIRDVDLEDSQLVISGRPISMQKNGQNRQISALSVFRWIEARRNFKTQILEQNIRTVIVVMASPWDLNLGKKLIRHGVEVIRVIHDGLPHKGEIFPPKFWISLLVKDCSKIFTLSSFVASQLENIYSVDPKKIFICQFPRPEIAPEVRNNFISSKKKILVIGRGKKYQGQELMESTWKLIPKEFNQLLIAGKGFKPNPKFPDIEYKNYWMSSEELIEEIATSDLVVFPYLEASQSGTIPICNALRVPVVVTPVGGLSEQIVAGITGLVANGVSPLQLSNAVVQALEFNWNRWEDIPESLNQPSLGERLNEFINMN